MRARWAGTLWAAPAAARLDVPRAVTEPTTTTALRWHPCLSVFIRGSKSFHQLARGVGLEIAGVAFIGVDVDLEFEAFVHAHQHFIKRDRARPANPQLHFVAGLHPVIFRVGRMH